MPATILVVDDVLSNRQLIAGYFAKTHHTLIFAEDGYEALRQVCKHSPDIILLDLRMPNLDGKETTYLLKKNSHTQGIPIIIITASSEAREREELEPICQGFLQKPVSRSQLIATIQPFLTLSMESIKSPSSAILETENIMPLNVSQLQEQLQWEMTHRWPLLQQKMTVGDLEKFTQDLLTLAAKHHCDLLLNYANTLQQQLIAFDWENIPNTVEHFADIFADIQALQ